MLVTWKMLGVWNCFIHRSCIRCLEALLVSTRGFLLSESYGGCLSVLFVVWKVYQISGHFLECRKLCWPGSCFARLDIDFIVS